MKYIETDKRFYKKLVKIALPIAMQSVITTGVNLVDTIMLGTLGETALSASSLATQFITLFTFLCMGISMGASVLTSRYWGAQNKDSRDDHGRTSFYRGTGACVYGGKYLCTTPDHGTLYK